MMSWAEVGEFTIKAGAVVTALAAIVRIVVRPMLIKPLGRYAKAELKEVVEEITTSLFASVLVEIGGVQYKLTRIESDLNSLGTKVRALERSPPDQKSA